MQADQLRSLWTSFFQAKDHIVVPSASLIPHDPTILFTVAGMVPFKPYFVGDEQPAFRRAVSIQKCVRAGGKHNDLDEIGRSARHTTFFEMLGNFSFGDYFKVEAIPWAWELITEGFGFDPERLWVTVHVSDDEAEAIWRDVVGVPAERIQRLDEDNFWRMADTGPCGPSSEIFWDKGPAHGVDGGPAHGADSRFVEFWNLVFMQFNQSADGTRAPLPKPSIDTGAGLERVLSISQGVDSVYDTDVLAPLVETAQSLSGVRLGTDERSDVSLRILAEHARTMTFLVADGVFPSNEDRGYVLRRIVRRAIRHAYLLGVERDVTPALVATTVEVMGAAYPDLVASADFVTDVLVREEARFRQTLKVGAGILDEALDALEGADARLDGAVAFQLHDTFGFPLEVTEEIAAERGVTVDVEGFDQSMAAQRTRAKAARATNASHASGDAYRALLDAHGPTEFTGRENDTSTARVLAVLPVPDEADGIVEVFLDRSPFYAEGGGQVGDTGTITTDTGAAEVLDTSYAVPGLHRHRARILDGELHDGQVATAAIDRPRRDAIRRNHTGTHILHWALREVLGDHVRQQGSLVAPEHLRFDFSHYEALTADQIRAIEDLANAEILANDPVRHYETTMEEASNLGAIAFFGDKYGDIVRVLEAGRHSVELCGGTHVRALGDIGPVKIVSEGSVGANLRRLVATTGAGTLARVREDEARLDQVASLLGVPADEVVTGVEKRLAELDTLRREVRDLRRDAAGAGAGALAGLAVDGIVVARRDGIGRDDLRDMAIAVRNEPGVRAVVLGGAPDGGGVALVSAVGKDSGLVASDLLVAAAKAVGGGCGKAPELAVAGGRDVARIDDALDLARVAAGISTTRS